MSETTRPDFKSWVQAARPRTLPAAAAPVLVGLALAWRDGVFHPLNALVALLISLLLQIGANLSNDLFDHERGTDTPDRLGPTRVTASGIISTRQMYFATGLAMGLAALLGLYLAFDKGWLVIWIGLAAILSALAYTGGPFPYGYYALGDVFVFIFFGLAAVCGTYFVQAGEISAGAWWGAVPMGLLIVNILVVNNTRDIPTDTIANKRTLAVLLGRKAMNVEYLLALLVSYLVPVWMWLGGLAPIGGLLVLLSAPKAVSLYREFVNTEGRALNKILGATAQLALIYAVLFSIGLAFLG